MAGKEAVMIILDCGKSMFEAYQGTSRKRLEVGLECITLLLQQKLIFNSKTHEAGMLMFGGDFGETDFYGMKMGRISLDTIRYVENLQPELEEPSGEGDALAALQHGCSILESHIGKKKFLKKIFLITTAAGTSSFTQHTISRLQNDITTSGCRVNVIAIDFGVESDRNTRVQSANSQMLSYLEKNCPLRVFPSNMAMEIYKQFRSKSVYPVAKYKGEFEVSPDLRLNVKVFSKTSEQHLPSLRKFSRASAFNQEEHTNKVQIDRFHYVYDDETLTPVPKENKVKGFYYGKKLIPVTNDMLEMIKYKSSKCLKLICFLPSENMPRHYFMSGVDMVIPEEGQQDSEGLAAIIQGMYELGTVALVRYVQREGLPPKLCVLSPHISTNYSCLWLNHLPTSEDFRDYSFPSLKECSKAQETAIQQFIEALDLTSAIDVETGEKFEGLVPNSTFNPVLQYFYQCLQFRAFHPEQPLPPLNPTIANYVRPDRQLFTQAEPAIKELKGIFQLKEAEKKEKGQRIFWREIAEKQRSSLEEKMMVESEAEKGEGEKKGIREEEDIKKHIGSVDPVADFKEMCKNTKVDLTTEAIEQMKEVIRQLVSVSLMGNTYPKALACLKAMREGAVEEDEATAFNDFLHDLKKTTANSRSREFWKMVVEEKVTLIDGLESPSSAVTAEEARSFLTKAFDGLMMASQPVQHEIDGLMDDIE